MEAFSNLLTRYSKHKEILLTIMQIILVYNHLRSGASIESIKNKRIVEKEIIPLLDNLKIRYIYRQEKYTRQELKRFEKIPGINLEKLQNNKPNLYISSKSIPKGFLNSPKSF